MSITDVPDTVLLESILPLLSIEELCKFSSVDKHFKVLSDSNEIWKLHYLKTIQNKYRITSKSVHTFGQELLLYENTSSDLSSTDEKSIYVYKDDLSCRLWRTHPYTYDRRVQYINREKCKFVKSLGCSPTLPRFTPYHSYFYTCSCMRHQYINILRSDRGSSCSLHAGLLPSKEDSQLMIEFRNINNVPDNMSYDKHRSLVFKNWKAFNEKNNLVQYCQDPLHYDITTLELPDQIKDFKSLKHIVLKKKFTEEKKTMTKPKKNKSQNDKIDRKIETLRLQLIELEKQKTKINNDFKREQEKIKNYDTCLQIIKQNSK